MNCKAKGSRAEYKTIRLLEARGYAVTRSSASLGIFDVIAIGPIDIRAVQVKAGTARCSPAEREQIQLLAVPANVSKEVWTFRDRAKAPIIERL